MADEAVTSADVTLPTSPATSSAAAAGDELATDVYAGWTVLQRAVNRTLIGSLQHAEQLNEETRALLARIG